MPQDGPLGPEVYKEILSHLEMAKQADAEIDKAKRAGVDVGDAKERVVKLKSDLLQIGRTYFPGKPFA
jgi:hypothetical protein